MAREPLSPHIRMKLYGLILQKKE